MWVAYWVSENKMNYREKEKKEGKAMKYFIPGGWAKNQEEGERKITSKINRFKLQWKRCIWKSPKVVRKTLFQSNSCRTGHRSSKPLLLQSITHVSITTDVIVDHDCHERSSDMTSTARITPTYWILYVDKVGFKSLHTTRKIMHAPCVYLLGVWIRIARSGVHPA